MRYLISRMGGFDSNGTYFGGAAACEDMVFNEWITVRVVYTGKTQAIYINENLIRTNTITNNWPVVNAIGWNDFSIYHDGPYDGSVQIDYFKIYGPKE